MISKSEIIKLKEALSYQTGSVVSKQIIKAEAGNITLFAFEKNESLSEHTVSFDAFVYIIEGNSKITIAKKPHFLKEGDFIIMPAGQPHSVLAVSRFKMLLVMVKGNRINF